MPCQKNVRSQHLDILFFSTFVGYYSLWLVSIENRQNFNVQIMVIPEDRFITNTRFCGDFEDK